MTTRWRRKLFALLTAWIVLAAAVPASAVEYWERTYGAELPFKGGQKIFTFKGKLLVLSNVNRVLNLYESADGKVWKLLQTPLSSNSMFYSRETPEIIVHNDAVYLMGQTSDGSGVTSTWIMRSVDCVHWVILRTDSRNAFVRYVASFSFGGYLYAALNDGIIERTNGAGAFPVWETRKLPNSQIAPDQKISFGTFKGTLFACTTYKQLLQSNKFIEVHRIKSDGGWERVSTIPVPNGPLLPAKAELIEHNGWLYLANAHIVYRTKAEGALPFQWEKSYEIPIVVEDLTYKNTISIVNVFGAVHMFSNVQPLKILDSAGNWQTANPTHIPSPFSFAEFGSTFFNMQPPDTSATGDIWTFERGVLNVTRKSLPATTLFAGQKGGSVLWFGVRSNGTDSITLKVTNIGTAAQGSSIAGLYLTKTSGGNTVTSLAPSAAFVPDPVNSKKWNSTVPFEVSDGDELFLAVDVSPTPVDGETCIFSVEGLFSQSNTSFQLDNPIISNQAIQIKNVLGAGALGPIQEVLIFPAPAKDVVHFMYDLPVVSDVEVKIFNELGVLVSEISDPGKPAGSRAETTWDASSKAPGVYLATIEIKGDGAGRRFYKRKVYIKK